MEKLVAVTRLQKGERKVLVPVTLKRSVLYVAEQERVVVIGTGCCRISESNCAALFLDVLNFYKNGVRTRCAFLDKLDDVFATTMGTA